MASEKYLHPILYLDDERDNLIVFNSAFRREYNIHLASSGQEGIEILKNNPVEVIITDQRMPEMTGIQFLEKIIPDYPDCIRMILTGFSDIDAIIQAINTGRVYRYITKPWSKEELKMNIDRAIETYQLRIQNKKLVEDLREANQTLEQKVIERTKKIELQNREITCSIQYASRIQNALLNPQSELKRFFQSYFILNRPKDIVSGDYYWLTRKGSRTIVAVADCTGHGVPGAFMSILGLSFLNEIIGKAETVKANEILNQLRTHVIRSLHQTGENDEARDGMEIALCLIDFEKMQLEFSGAFRPLYLFRNGDILELSGDHMPIGIYENEDQEISFTSKEIAVEKGDILYLFTDGYLHQMGGGTGRTFKSQNFKALLKEIHTFPMERQQELLEAKLLEWKGDLDQVDDILVVGIRL